MIKRRPTCLPRSNICSIRVVSRCSNVSSQAIVRRYRHSQWDSEHVLLALLEDKEGVPAEILKRLDVSVDAMHDRLNQLLQQAPNIAEESVQIYVAPRAARMLDRAKSEADRLNDEFIGTEHLLVALA